MNLRVDLILWYRYRGELSKTPAPSPLAQLAREMAPFDLRAELERLIVDVPALAARANAPHPDFVGLARSAWRELCKSPVLGPKARLWKVDWASPIESVDVGSDKWEPVCNDDGCKGPSGLAFPWNHGGSGLPVFERTPRSANVIELEDGWAAEVYLQFVRPVSVLDRANRCRRELTNPLDEPALGVALLFADARTRLLGVRAEDAKVSSGRRSELLQVVEFDVPLSPGRAREFEVVSLGDPPYLRQAIWLTEERDERRRDERPGDRWPIGGVQRLEELVRSFSEVLVERQAKIETRADHERARRFFYEMDSATLPARIQDPLTKQRLSSLALYLESRWRRRAHVYADTQQAATFDAKEILSREQEAVTAASILEPLFDVFGQGSARIEGAAEAFALFAGGALREIETHGVPNGVYYFSFGELTLLLRELGHSQDFWGPLIAPLCRTAEIFVNAFHTPFGPRSSCAYHAETNLLGERAYDSARIANLEQHWAKTDVAWQFSRLVATALADEVGPVANPYPLDATAS